MLDGYEASPLHARVLSLPFNNRPTTEGEQAVPLGGQLSHAVAFPGDDHDRNRSFFTNMSPKG